MTYGLTVDNQNLIIEKSKTKKDGVYQIRGVMYKVVNGSPKYYSDGKGIYQGYGSFNVVLQSFKWEYQWEKRVRKIMEDME